MFRGVTSLPVRCDGSMSDGRPKGLPSTRLGKQPPYGLAVAHPRPPRHRQRGPGWRLVAVAAAGGREGSKRSVVAAAGVMVVQRRRWIGTGATWAVRVTEYPPLRQCRKIRRGNGGDVVDGGGKPSPFWASRHLLQPPYSFSELRLAIEGLSALNLAIEGLSALIGRVWSDPPLSHGQWLGNGHLEEFGQHLLCLTGSGWEKGPPRHRHQWPGQRL